MRWKNLSYWAKGGIGGILTSLIIFTVTYLFDLMFPSEMGMSMILIILPSILLRVLIPFSLFELISDSQALLLLVSFSLSTYFILGALIGLIVGKIKKSNKKRK